MIICSMKKQIEKLESKSFRTHRNNNPSSCSKKAEAGGQNQKLMDILDRLKRRTRQIISKGNNQMQCTGAYILLGILKREGVDVLFGYPGGAVVIFMMKCPSIPKFAISLPGMSGGLFMRPDGYARGHREKQACLVTSGPGATNTVTGIATAYCDSIPPRSHYRPGSNSANRQRRLSGSGYCRHYAPVHQAQFSGQECGKSWR